MSTFCFEKRNTSWDCDAKALEFQGLNFQSIGFCMCLLLFGSWSPKLHLQPQIFKTQQLTCFTGGGSCHFSNLA